MKLMRKQNILNNLSFPLVVAVILFIGGCGASPSQPEVSRQYVLTAGKVDNFYVLSSDLDDMKKPRYIKYAFTGILRNNTDHIYADGTIKMEVTVALENGNVLAKKDFNDIPFNDIQSSKYFHNWKPGQIVKIDKLVSISIPAEYADYPVKDVVLEYSLDLVDKVNQTHEEISIASISVVDKWKQAAGKVKLGKADVDDYHFPDIILNKATAVDKSKDAGGKLLIDE